MSEPTAFRRSPDQGMPESIRSLTGKLSRKTLPLYLSMLSDTVGGIVTVAVLGHTKTAELAAYALVIALFNPLLMVVRGSLRGSMPFAAEHEDDASTLAPLVRDSTWLAILMGVLGALFLSTLPLLAPGLGVAAPTVAALGLFPLVLAGNMVVVAIKASVTTLLVALGRNRGVLVISLVTTASTIGSVPLLVLGVGPLPALGLIGAGAAMLLVSVVTTVLSQYLLRRHTVLRHHPVGLGAPRWGDVWQIAKVGLPTGMTLLVKFGTMSVLALAVARIGPVEAATHQLLVVVTTFAFMPAVAAAQSAIPLTARAARDGDRTEVRRTLVAGYLTSLPVIGFSVALLWVAAAPLAGLLSADPLVREGVVALVPLLTAVVLADAMQSLPGLGLVALKNTRPSLYAFLGCYGLLSAAALPIAEHGGLSLLWSAYAVATFGLVVLQILAFGRLSARVSRTGAGQEEERSLEHGPRPGRGR